VGKDVDHRNFHQSAQADCRAAVVAEDQKTGSERSNLGHRQAIEHRAHGVLANTEVEIPPGRVLRTEISGAFKSQPRLA
jgi:hypothetical protein